MDGSADARNSCDRQGKSGAARLTRFFLYSAGILLLLTAAAKLVSSGGAAPLLDMPDPICEIRFRYVFWIVAPVELVVAFVCLSDKPVRLQAGMVAWLATNFLVYRLGPLWIGYHKPCGCLGNITEALGISPATAEGIVKGVLVYLLVGSYGVLTYLSARGGKRAGLKAAAGSPLPGGDVRTSTDSVCGPEESASRHARGRKDVGTAAVRAALTLCVFCERGDAGEQWPPFSAEAKVRVETFRPRGTEAVTREEATTQFHFDGGTWEVVYVYGAAWPEVTGGQRTQPGTVLNCRRIPDGIRYFPTFPSTQADHAPKPLTTALAEPLTFPPPEYAGMLASWLMLCPHAELPVVGEGRIRRFLTTPLMKNRDNEGSCFVSFVTPENAFLSQLIITNDGTIFTPDATPIRLEPPFDPGFVEFEYRLLESTNLLNRTFPRRAEARQFGLLPDAKTRTDVYPAVVVSVEVQSLSFPPASTTGEKAPPTLFVMDNRSPALRSGASVRLLVTNDHWVSVTNRKMVKLAEFWNKQAKKEATRKSAALAVRSNTVRAILLAAVLMPFGVWVLLRLVNKNKEQQTRSHEKDSP